jgi:hypothetical protein
MGHGLKMGEGGKGCKLSSAGKFFDESFWKFRLRITGVRIGLPSTAVFDYFGSMPGPMY